MFKLLRYFSLTSLASVAAAAALLGVFYRYVAIDNLLESGQRSNVALTKALANTLRSQYAPLLEGTGRQPDRESALHQSVLRSVAGLSVLKVKVYDPEGRTIYSSDPKQIGEDKSRNAGFLSARSGKPATELTHRGTFSAFEQTIENLDVLSSYVPVYGGDAMEAVFEIYDDVTPVLAHVKRTQIEIIAGVILVLGALYGVLFLIVGRADRILHEQEIAHRRDQEALRRSEIRMRMIADNVPALIGYVDADQRYRFVNKAYEEWFGWKAEEASGKSMKEVLGETTYELRKPYIEAALRGERIVFEQHHVRNGGDFYLQATYIPDLEKSDQVAGFFVLANDITDRKKTEAHLTSLALHDALTGLPNRRLFFDRISQHIAYGRRNKTGVGVLFFDLDGFKEINDTLGHDTGDLLLKAVAERLVASVRKTDTVARIGGDEFVVIALSEISTADDAATVAAKLIAAVAQPYTIQGRTVSVTTSVGIGIYPEHGEDAEALMKSADLALYEAKSAGKNVYRIARQAGEDSARLSAAPGRSWS